MINSSTNNFVNLIKHVEYNDATYNYKNDGETDITFHK